jgi:hypothetical protein
MSTYSEFQNDSISNKIVLARVDASIRVMGFTAHAPTIYKKINFDVSKVRTLENSGVGLTEVFGLSDVVPGTFFNDRQNKTLYVELSDLSNPNGSFIVATFPNFFSNTPVQAPWDIGDGATGFDVLWEPLISKVSGFGVRLDNDDQIGFALEGTGGFNFALDREYFDTRYEGFVWEQQRCEVYSWTTGLPFSEARPLFKGAVNSKGFGRDVSFKLKDQIEELRRRFPVKDISELPSKRVPEGLLVAKQRKVYGRVNGFRPTNIDQLIDSFPLTGTVSGTTGSKTLTGLGTSFVNDFSPNDRIVLGGFEFTIESITSDTSMELTEAPDFDLAGGAYSIIPEQPKNYINREWLVAGHACSQLETTVVNAFNQGEIVLGSALDISVGDEIYVGAPGSRERAFVEKVFSDDRIRLTTNLQDPPTVGTIVVRPCIQALKINNLQLTFDRDFTISVTTDRTTLTLNEDAEKNVNPIRRLNGTIDITMSSTSVTGTGTQFTSQLLPGQHIRAVGQVEFFQIASIESDTSLTLVSAATYTELLSEGQYKGGTNFNPENDVLSCTVLGATADNVVGGALLKTAGSIVKDALNEAGVGNLNLASFDLADERAPYTLGFVIPESFSSTQTTSLRDVINKVNVSVFGSLVQNEDFQLEYGILHPNRPPSALIISEAEVIAGSLKITSQNDRVVKRVLVDYDFKEYDPTAQDSSFLCFEKLTNEGQFLVKSDKEKTVMSVLVFEDDARILANRWGFLLSTATNVISFKTKLQTSQLQVNDVIFIDHKDLFERIGGGKRKFGAVSRISKTEGEVTIELDDLGNAFNRVCVISKNGVADFSSSNETAQALNGFITDDFGLINNDNFGLNLIW